jgi:hypothetical protein
VTFRPEHSQVIIDDSQTQHAIPNRTAQLTGEVQTIEFGGGHWLIQCRIGEEICLVRLLDESPANGSLRKLRNGEKIRIAVPLERIRLFPTKALLSQ